MKTFLLKMQVEQYTRFITAADAAGLSFSEWIRRACEVEAQAGNSPRAQRAAFEASLSGTTSDKAVNDASHSRSRAESGVRESDAVRVAGRGASNRGATRRTAPRHKGTLGRVEDIAHDTIRRNAGHPANRRTPVRVTDAAGVTSETVAEVGHDSFDRSQSTPVGPNWNSLPLTPPHIAKQRDEFAKQRDSALEGFRPSLTPADVVHLNAITREVVESDRTVRRYEPLPGVSRDAVNAYSGKTIGEHEDIAKGPPIDVQPVKRGIPTCDHGVERGMHCWQCGGKAKIAGEVEEQPVKKQKARKPIARTSTRKGKR